MLDGRPRRSARATIVTGDHHMVGLALGHTRCNRAHTNFGHQLDADVAVRGHVLQVVDQLGQVLDGVDVMVRRWRDQTDTGHRMAQLADVIGHFTARQLAAFTGFGTLGHLDLDLVGAGQVFGRHTEAARRDLFDLGAQAVTGGQRHVHFDVFCTDHTLQGIAQLDRDASEFVAVTVGVFTALARVALAADAVHGHGQSGVRFGGDRAQRHRAGGETFDDFGRRLDLLQRDGFGRVDLELEQAAQRHVALALVVDDLRVFLVGAEVVGTGGVLQLGNRIRRPHVLFTTRPPSVFAACVQHGGQDRIVAKCSGVHPEGFFGDLEHANAAHAAGGAGEVLVDGFGVDANGFKQL